MTLHKILKGLSIVSYFLIFVDGEHVGGPMIVLMFLSIFETDSLTQIFIALAFFGLIGLIALTMFKKNYWTFLIEALISLMLALPIINELQYERYRLFHYPMFVIPTICFLLFYILSLYFSYGVKPKYLLAKKD